MLTPSKLDPNYKTEMERKKREPHTFGMGIPLPDEKRNMTGSGLTADRGKIDSLGKTRDVGMYDFLDQIITDITPQLGAMDAEQLEALHAAETAGKARTVLLKAIEKQLDL